uniref:Orosomucoid 1 n=1 Tax=Sarcophilus harrisii TaxID=9305 RepID=A0A7N4P5L8_SARHA
MLLGWTLFLLSLAPLLMGQQPDCVSVTPAFNDTILDQLSGKWYYIASVFEFLPYKEEAQSLQSSFFYMIPNKTEDIILAKEYNTIGDKCVYQDFELPFNRTNGTIFKIDSTKQHSAQVALTQDLNALYFVYFANGKVRPGLALCGTFSSGNPGESKWQEMEVLVQELLFNTCGIWGPSQSWQTARLIGFTGVLGLQILCASSMTA